MLTRVIRCIYIYYSVCVCGQFLNSSPHDINVSSLGSHMERGRLGLTMTPSHITSELHRRERRGEEGMRGKEGGEGWRVRMKNAWRCVWRM